jgi:hypothetical protein
MNGQGTEYPARVVLPELAPKALRDQQSLSSGVTFVLCRRCWGPVAQGMMEAHLAAAVHQDSPSPELP